MGFNWSGAARGATQGLEEMMAERYARTEEARRVARQIALDEEAKAERTFNRNQGISDRALAAMNLAEQKELDRQERERRGIIDARTAQQWEDQQRRLKKAEDQETQDQAVQAMAIQGVEGGGYTPHQAVLMGLKQGVNIPEAALTSPEDEDKRALDRLGKELRLRQQYDTTGAGGNTAGTQLQRTRPDGTIEFRNAVGAAAINQAYREGFTPEPSAAQKALIKTPAEIADARSTTATALDHAIRLYNHPGIDEATGVYEARGHLTQQGVNFNALRNQLVAALTLPNLGALKGPMTEKELRFVQSLSTRLQNEDLDKVETQRAINEAITFLSGKLNDPVIQPNVPSMIGSRGAPALRGQGNAAPGGAAPAPRYRILSGH